MDDPFAVDVVRGSPTAAETARSSISSSRMSEGLKAGQRIAKISVITLVAIGIVELAMGRISGSIVATADGIDSLSDAMISLIVFVGLYLATRPANKKFPFGYYKVESFAALIAAIGMIAIGAFILFHSYESLVDPRPIEQPVLTMIVLAAAGAISLHRALQMRKIARKYDLLSLKTDAKNSIKDGSASIIGFFSVLVASQFGFLQMDAIGGMIIAGYIFSVAYFSLRQSSLTLVDAWQNPGTSDNVKQLIEAKFQAEPVRVRSVFLRPTGMMAHAEVHIEVDGDKKLADFESLSVQIQSLIRSRFRLIDRISVIPHPISFGGQKKKTAI
ncbi:MAG TPA: cation diffusion facilitator family transporter [Nitrososphaera sp.]|nr:cation diffusion facilitator family transporter [Nitrososphaera sp.]